MLTTENIPERIRNMSDQQLQAYKATLEVMSGVTTRQALISRYGQQYGGDRDIYTALGYKTVLEYKDYESKYERQDMAAAVIDRPIEATWKDQFTLVESSDDEFTPLENEWEKLCEEFDLTGKFERLDTLAAIGQYSIMLLGFDDVVNAEGNMTPITGPCRLLYVKPISQGNATIAAWDMNTASPRFGLPEKYSVTIKVGTGDDSRIISVHHSRVIHVVGKILESEVLGTPALTSVYNRLDDLEKVVGASAEMFWRGGRPGYAGKVEDGYSMSDSAKEDLLGQIAEYENNLRRVLIAQGVTLEALASQVADPASHVDILIQMISAVTGIPKRILTGSERGELASTSDRDAWKDLIDSRRSKIATRRIIRPFIDRCIEYAVLPPVKSEEEGYGIEWPDSYALTESDRVNIGQVRATALREYATNPVAEDMLPLEAFLKIILGLDDNQIALIEEMREAQLEERIEEEERILLEREEAMKKEQENTIVLRKEESEEEPEDDDITPLTK